jgi:hypothetical protein
MKLFVHVGLFIPMDGWNSCDIVEWPIYLYETTLAAVRSKEMPYKNPPNKKKYPALFVFSFLLRTRSDQDQIAIYNRQGKYTRRGDKTNE